MTICMPAHDETIIVRRAQIVKDLQKIITDPARVLGDEDDRRTFDSDAMVAYRQLPLVVVLPINDQEISKICQYCQQHGIKIVARGSGTSLSGGAHPLGDAILLVLSKLNKILDIDYENRCVVVQPGVTNLNITKAVEDKGFFYAPDPSSQLACSIGGNIAENSGGAHCLKYGMTTNNILGLTAVLLDGTIITLGGKFNDNAGLDIMGLLTGSEGLLAVITEVIVRIIPKPEVTCAMLVGFDNPQQAGFAVAGIISAGYIPAAIEMMDKPSIKACEDFAKAGYPLHVGALLIIECDGPAGDVASNAQLVEKICNDYGAITFKQSYEEKEKAKIWLGRKSAFPACARLAPDYIVMDGTIPRKKLGYVLGEIDKLEQEYQLPVMNVFHAGDGNLHPLILFDGANSGEQDKAEEFGFAILKLCVSVGGVLSGEHGIGIEKRDLMTYMFQESDLQQQHRVKWAFDPENLLNPGKVFPTLHRCAESGFQHIHHGQVKHPHLPVF